ncbi:restriction endonuclease [Streptomyces griseoincarnatus]
MSRVRERDKSQGKKFWRKFEEEVERAVSDLGNARVERDVRVPGVLSGRPRQIDVIARGEVAGCPMTVIFEAKCYAGLVQIGRVDELVGKALDVAAQSAVLYSPRGFSLGAQARAVGTQNSPLRIGLAELRSECPDASPDDVEIRFGRQVPDQVRAETTYAHRLTHLRVERAPFQLVETDDYERFFRGEAPLFLSR